MSIGIYVQQISGERLQDHWSSGLTVYAFDTLHSCIPWRRCIDLRRNKAYDHMILHSKCIGCDTPFTVKHFLLECTDFAAERIS